MSYIKSIFIGIVVILLCIPFYSIFSGIKKCTPFYFSKYKTVEELYKDIRKQHSICILPTSTYLEYANRALLNDQAKLALWSAQIAQNKLYKSKFFNKNYYESTRNLGLSYIQLNRYEEAIQVLRKVVFSKKDIHRLKKYNSLHQKIFLTLIKAYYTKADNSIDKNVRYLLTIYKNRFSNSPYLQPLKRWVDLHKNKNSTKSSS